MGCSVSATLGGVAPLDEQELALYRIEAETSGQWPNEPVKRLLATIATRDEEIARGYAAHSSRSCTPKSTRTAFVRVTSPSRFLVDNLDRGSEKDCETMTKPLKFGETPWDDMPREKLLREVQRMYSALVAVQGPLNLFKIQDSTSPFWSIRGTGGRAFAKVEQCLAPYPDEPAYTSFFRYAVDLLFEGLGSKWMICGKCQGMTGSFDDNPPASCAMCHVKGEQGGTMRPIRWDDLKPMAKR